MQIQIGDVLTAPTGDRYRVLDLRDQIVSLMRLNGCTLFSCHLYVVEAFFQVPQSS